ncbi:MAG: ABC transporter ATP-binding protein [bacterium]|nr:ABC transporter ATP-binding protein [bacterium]
MSLRLDNLRHIYTSPAGETRQVLDIPHWRVEAGQQVLLRGVSGSGKTTLLNIIAGLLHPTQGQVWYDLRDMGEQSLYALREETRDRLRARAVGYIFQNHHLLASLTALENVVMPMAFARVHPAREWRPLALALLEKVGLADFADYRPAKLSTGQRLRVAIARALANRPPLLLADEPTAALDPASGEAVMRLMQDTCRQQGALLLVASHDPALAALFDCTLHLQAGQLMLGGSVA